MTGAIPLDPFTHIIAVHWPEGEMTKLDFVGGRYMVRNHNQAIEDVVDHPEYRVEGQGAILPNDLSALYNGWKWLRLINKPGFGEDHLLGAMNEAMRFNYTIIYEADWLDTAQQWIDFNDNGFFPPSTWDTQDVLMQYAIHNSYSDAVGAQLMQGYQLVHDPGHADQTVTGSGDYDVWLQEPDGPYEPAIEGESGAFSVTNGVDGGGLTTVWLKNTEGGGSVYRWTRDAFYQYEDVPASYRNGSGGFYFEFWGTEAELPHLFNGPSSRTYPGWDPYDYYKVAPGLVPGDYVNGGSAWRALSTTDVRTDYPRAYENFGYGRFRTAVTFGPDYIEMSTNGGPAVKLVDPSRIVMPQPGNTTFVGGKFDGKKGHVYAVDDPVNFFRLGGGVKLRCIWILRKKQKTKTLRRMSIVKSLYETDDPRWKKPKYI